MVFFGTKGINLQGLPSLMPFALQFSFFLKIEDLSRRGRLIRMASRQAPK